MLRQIRSVLGGFITNEEGVREQSMLPVAWVGGVMMIAAVVLSMPEKAHAGICWTSTACQNQHPYYCQSVCAGSPCHASGWSCTPFPGTLQYRCKCYN